MSNLVRHPYHLVDESPWPLISSLSGMILVIGLTSLFSQSSIKLLLLGIILILLSMAQWWRDVSTEGSALGYHSAIVELGLRWGMFLFIISEVFFFLSFFWAFFHSSLSPTIELGGHWPPVGVLVFSAFEVPLLNTLVLLSSGITVTYSHHFLSSGVHKEASIGLSLTIMLGVYFSFLQGMEYWEASFNIADSVYGSTFFLATGFHGLHVLIGTFFLSVCWYRLNNFLLSSNHHFGFEAAAWYWHFVDVVWLFLYVSIYWWGGSY